MATMTGGEAVVRQLIAEGVEVVFGLPGVHAMQIYDALYHHREIRHIGVRHEQAAAYMSDGYARTTGLAGVCLTTTGPGAANTTAAMAEAYASSSPVLNITTQIESNLVDRGKGALHEGKDQLALFKAVTGWNRRVEKAADIADCIHLAMKKMCCERPRPIQVEIPADLLGEATDAPLCGKKDKERACGDAVLIKEAAKRLLDSRLPVIWAGGGVITSGATPELLRLAETLEAPVMTTYMGKGAIPEDHPLSLGNWGMGSDVREMLQDLLQKSDVILAVGTRFSALSTGEWSLRLPGQLIQVDIDETEVGKNYPAEIGIIGDAKRILGQILQYPNLGKEESRPSPAPDIKALKGLVYEIMAATRIREMEIIDTLRMMLDRDAILVNDMTLISYAASRHFPVYEPRTFLYPSGFGTLGFAFPAALGAKVARPRRQVVAVCGDGGFMFGCQELATAVQFGLNLPVIIFNDGGYGTLKAFQDLAFSGRRVAVDLINPDFVKFAESFGAGGVRVESLKELKPALEKALAADRPTLIDFFQWMQ